MSEQADYKENRSNLPSAISLKEPLPKQLWLAFDTSTAQLTTALVRGDEVLGHVEEIAQQNHSIKLVPDIQALLEAHGVRIEDLQGIAAGYGPGSYTGVRIGVTVAKTLAWALQLPLLGISSTEALAFGTALERGLDESSAETAEAAETSWIIPLINGRRGRAYTGLYAMNQGTWTPMLPDGIRPVSDWLKHLAQMQVETVPDRILLTGEIDVFQAEISDFEANNDMAKWETAHAEIHAEHIARLAGYRSEQVLSGDKVHEFVPNYTQVAEAEAKFNAHAKRS